MSGIASVSEPGAVSENETSSLGDQSQVKSAALPPIQSDSESRVKRKKTALFWAWLVVGTFLILSQFSCASSVSRCFSPWIGDGCVGIGLVKSPTPALLLLQQRFLSREPVPGTIQLLVGVWTRGRGGSSAPCSSTGRKQTPEHLWGGSTACGVRSALLFWGPGSQTTLSFRGTNCLMLSADQADNIKLISSLCVSSHRACVTLLGGNKRVIFLVFRGYEATSRILHLAGCASWHVCWQPYSRGSELIQVHLSASSTVAAGPCLPNCVSLTQWLGNPGC